VLGYNFGDGHFHNEQLLAAVQERCHYAAGELRVVMIESQPAHVQRQRYRICDAATGLIEEGYVKVADMVERQPWLGEDGAFPVKVTDTGAGTDTTAGTGTTADAGMGTIAGPGKTSGAGPAAQPGTDTAAVEG
jgi:Transmembrane protein of unknown function (DUF3556)